MKVLHIYKAYPPVVGGIEHHVRQLAEAQAARGVEVTVVVASGTDGASDRSENGVRVIRTRPWATLASTPLSPGLAGWVRRLTADVAHLQFPYPPGEVAQHLLGKSTATIISYQSDIVRQRVIGRLYQPIMRRVLRKADRILVSSPTYLETSPHLAAVRDRCSVLPPGVDPQRFGNPDAARVAAIRAQYGEPLVVFVGKMRYYKGLETLIEAAAAIDAGVLLVGTGPVEAELRRRATATPVGPSPRSTAQTEVAFAGEVADDDLPNYYAAADVFVLPSSHRSEAFGLVQLEAMASGRPVVSTELGTGTSFVNQHGDTGLVVAPRDPGALATAINSLLADADERTRMGNNGRRRVEQEFHVDRMVHRTLEVYRQALAGRRPSH